MNEPKIPNKNVVIEVSQNYRINKKSKANNTQDMILFILIFQIKTSKQQFRAREKNQQNKHAFDMNIFGFKFKV